MIKNIKVNLCDKTYPVIVGEKTIHLLPDLIKKTKIGQDAIVISTQNIYSLHGENIKQWLKKSCKSVSWLNVADTEQSKSIFVAVNLIDKITLLSDKKDIFLVAFGGGVIGDLTGFIAAIYRRGIPYIQIPTTLLAQVDSSIGGKTALDTKFGKNLIGAFYQPKFVLADTSFLKTLPKKEILAGLAEIIKYAIIKDKRLFYFLKRNIKKILQADQKTMEYIIATCASIKARIVSKDEFDKKDIRIILNFGHTIGHAIEAASDFKVSHGDAVSLGMIYASRISEAIGLLNNKKDASKIIHLIKETGLPFKIPHIDPQAILKKMNYDKKIRKGKLRFVVPEDIGKVCLVENIPCGIILKTLKQPI